MKKHLVKVLSIVMALTMVLGVFGPYAVFAQNTATTHQDDVECDHVWGDVVVDDIRCDEAGNIVSGKIYRECTVDGCDEIDDLLELTESNIFAILGIGCQQHGAYVYEIAEGDEPTCTEAGKLTLTCPVCGDGFGTGNYEIPIKALGHISNGNPWTSELSWTRDTDPTCTETGLDVRTCDRCGEEDERTVAKLDHKLTNGTSAYVKINPADACGCTVKVTNWPKPENAPANFAWAIEQPSTCYQEGWVFKHCTLCHDVIKADAEETDHPWKGYYDSGNSWVLDYEVFTGSSTCMGSSTPCECTKTTTYFKVCSVCGFYEEDVSMRETAVGHTWESKTWNGTNPESPFCSDKGWTKVEDASLPTCDPDSINYYVRECTVCNCEEKVDYFFTAHDMTKYVCPTHTTNCTDCTDAGRELICAECGKNPQDATYTDHNWVDDDANDTPATCTTNRIDAFKCSHANCGATDTEEAENSNIKNPTLPEHHSNWIQTHIQPSTCTEAGFETGYCTDCSSSVVTYELPLAAHTPDNKGGGYAQTCTTAGKKDLIECSVCGEVLQAADVIPADGTSHPATVNSVANTATVVGQRLATCVIKGATIKQYSGCGCIVEADVTNYAPNNHMKYTYNNTGVKTGEESLIKTSVLVPATCVEDGNHEYQYCEGCEKIISINTTSCAANNNCKLTAAQHTTNFTNKYLNTSYKVNGDKLTIAKLGHNFNTTQLPKLNETCNVPGNQAIIYCTNSCCANVADDADMGPNTLVKGGKVYLVKSSHTVVNGERVTGMIAQDGSTIAPHGFGHIWENTTDVYDATCTEDGKAGGKFCELCPTDFTTPGRCCNGPSDVIPATGHNLVKVLHAIGGVTVNVVRCTNVACTRDLEANPGAIYVKGNSKVNTGTGLTTTTYDDTHGKHIWYAVDYTVTTTSTPVAPNTCEHPETSIIDDVVNSIAPDCVNDGLAIKKCADCGEQVSATVVPALGHKNAAGNYIYLDCQNYANYVGQECDVCHNIAGTNIQHNLEYVYEAPDCEKAEDAQKGKEYYVCADCDLVVDVVTYAASVDGFIDATYDPTTVAPAVGEIGFTTALYVSTVEYVPATSTTPGSWTWLCVCGDEHTHVLNYTYSLEFDVEVNPYTENAEATELTFVNGGLVEVLVSVTAEDVAINALEYKLGYNNKLFTFVSAEIVYDDDAEAEGVQNHFETPTVGVNATNITLLTTAQTGVDAVVITGEKVPFIKYVFKLSEGATAIAATDITLMVPDFVAMADAGVAVVNNQLTEGKDVALMGDLNDDNVVDIKDLVEFRAISNANGYNVAADFDNNGAVDFLDLIALNNFLVSDKTVADYYTMLGIDIAAEIAGYDYRDFDASGTIDLNDAAAFKNAFNAILNTGADYTAILGADNVAAILAAANA